MSWSFDPSHYEEKTFSLIPAGDYRLRIIDVEERTFRSGNEGYTITFEVAGQDRKVWHNLVLNKNDVRATNQRIGELFESFGITERELGTGQNWIGCVGAARIKHDEYNGKTKEVVGYFIGKNRQDNLPPWEEKFEDISPDDLPF